MTDTELMREALREAELAGALGVQLSHLQKGGRIRLGLRLRLRNRFRFPGRGLAAAEPPYNKENRGGDQQSRQESDHSPEQNGGDFSVHSLTPSSS